MQRFNNKFRSVVMVIALLLITPISICLSQNAHIQKGKPLVVGWSDEFNAKHNWQRFPPPHQPDLSQPHKGLLSLSLGSKSKTTPQPAFYWASATRFVEVDIERYPILAVRAVGLKGPSWWDVIVQGVEKESKTTLAGSEIKTPSLDHDGIILFDIQEQVKHGLELSGHRFRIRLNIAGLKQGGSIQYDWIRFVRREDAARLRTNPQVSELIVEP